MMFLLHLFFKEKNTWKDRTSKVSKHSKGAPTGKHLSLLFICLSDKISKSYQILYTCIMKNYPSHSKIILVIKQTDYACQKHDLIVSSLTSFFCVDESKLFYFLVESIKRPTRILLLQNRNTSMSHYSANLLDFASKLTWQFICLTKQSYWQYPVTQLNLLKLANLLTMRIVKNRAKPYADKLSENWL